MTAATAAEEFDMVVVGAGWFGLSAARTHIALHPADRTLVLEAAGSVGGTWAAERLYPGLKSNNLLDSYEHPDLPMDTATYGVKPGEHIPGAVLHRYLTDFAARFGVLERTRLNTRVASLAPAEVAAAGWVLATTTTTGTATTPATLRARKVILATGLTSSPNLPAFPGAETFAAPLFHAKDFHAHASTVDTARRAVVVGGAKSAYDVAYAYARAGASVELVMRPGGNGPVWMSRPWVMGGAKRLEKLLHVRWMTWMSPCPWGGEDGWSLPRRLLHGTRLGRWLVDAFWGMLGADVVQLNGYDGRAAAIRPWNPPFWIGSGLSIHNYDESFFDMVADGRVRVRVADVARLSERAVHLSTGEALPADVLVAATGWRKEPSVRFDGFGAAGIGLARDPVEMAKLVAKADADVLARFPRLKDQPVLKFAPKTDPFRLYRFMVPPGRVQDRNIAFAGLVSSASTTMCAAAQALWIAAFLDGRLDRLASGDEEVTREVMLHTQWGKWRYPTGYGASLPDFVFDAVPYFDLLLNDLGLKANRKQGWFTDLSEPYGPPDYAGLVDEWVASHSDKKTI